jgi:diadenosine tetraphosphate (Ap4A) HIT family hydrolase
MPKRHISSFFELGSSEQKACLNLLEDVKRKILEKDETVTGFNVGINIGKDAGQTIFHCHIHLIPRRIGDVSNPEGGVRNIISEKGKWK